ncbi:MAG TPA: cytochrome c peroxidase [Blastocatellia bacterium]|nr:cytochrome c peroxidase [Blastocatellia bacterium]
MLSVAMLLIGSVALTLGVNGQHGAQDSAVVTLGQRLFEDSRLSSPEGDLANSCSSCHLQDQDPQGHRVFTDFFNRSWVPYRSKDPRRSELRNSPTILDSASMPSLHFDGEYASLEDLVRATLSGRPMGWLPTEANQAFDHIYKTILEDSGEPTTHSAKTYADEFKRAFNVDIKAAGRQSTIDLTVNAISSYVRTLKSARNTPYDRFAAANALPSSPRQNESVRRFAHKLLEQIASLESEGSVRFVAGFEREALSGFKIFLTTSGASASGNCVTCHAPPLFTDLSFHNMGVSQAEYESIHGTGSFERLPIPNAAAANRPSTDFRETPTRENASLVDLGHWNFVDVKASPLRRAGETEDRFLARMIATFKTPTLRNLAYSHPYLHNGAFTTLEATLLELKRLSELARKGQIRKADEDLVRIRISEDDIKRLTAFLRTLND